MWMTTLIENDILTVKFTLGDCWQFSRSCHLIEMPISAGPDVLVQF